MDLDGKLVGGLEHFLFSHIFGIIIPIDFHIFQRGSNHQPVNTKPSAQKSTSHRAEILTHPLPSLEELHPNVDGLERIPHGIHLLDLSLKKRMEELVLRLS